MKLSVDTQVLIKTLQGLGNAVEKKNMHETNKALFCVKMQCVDSKIHFLANNLELQIADSCACECEAEGTILIPYHITLNVIKGIKNDTIVFETQDENDDTAVLTVKAGRSRFKIVVFKDDSNLFTDFALNTVESTIVVNSGKLLNSIDKIHGCISNNDTRYNLTGLLLHYRITDGKKALFIVATDGHRLGVSSIESDSGDSEIKILLPKKAVSSIASALKQEHNDKDVAIQIGKGLIKITLPTTSIVAKVMDATFPDYTKVVPYNNDKILEVDKADMLAAIKSVSAVVEDYAVYGMQFNIKQNSVEVSCSQNNNFANTVIDGSNFSSSEELSVSYNPKYILESLASMDSKQVRWKIKDRETSALITSMEDNSLLYVVMPLIN